MKIALLQFNPAYLQVDKNLATIAKMIRETITKEDVDLLVLPELFASGYFFKSASDLASVAEDIPSGKTTQFLSVLAAEFEMTIVAGLPEKTAEGIYNSAVVVTPAGEFHTYRKVHLFNSEKNFFLPGDLGFPVFEMTDSAGGTYNLGVMICFDWYFPESARSLALGGADIIAHPANLVRKDCPRSMPIRALENHIYTVTANRWGTESAGGKEISYIGRSLICSPDGDVLSEAGTEDSRIFVVEVDVTSSRDRQITELNDLFKDRRPGAYFTAQK